MKIRHLCLALFLCTLGWIPQHKAEAGTPPYWYCIQSTQTLCNSLTVNPGNGTQGDQLWQGATKFNFAMEYLAPIWTLVNGYCLSNNGAVLVWAICGSGGGGGTPGGSSGQLQYNNAGSFAGVTNSSATLADLGTTTAYTIAGTGCTPTIISAGPFGGVFRLASGPCTSVLITINGATGFTAPNGYHCSVGDRTTLQAGTWIPSWNESTSTVTTATIPIPGASGTSDIITFGCDWF